jgi:tetratricopeptide (TPR) repeat protein
MDLAELARRVREGDKSKLDRYKELVASQGDVELLKQVANSNWQEDEISIPAYERALQINPNQAEILASLGLIKYLIGEDAEAFQCLEKARRISLEGLQVLTLQAAFEKRPEEQVKLYRKMLQLDPSNRVALQNLERLEGKPR